MQCCWEWWTGYFINNKDHKKGFLVCHLATWSTYTIYRLLYSIYMIFAVSFIRFNMISTGSLIFDLHENLQAPLFDLHDIYRFRYSIYMIFTGSLTRFTWYLQAPLFCWHDIYMLYAVILSCHLQGSFSIYMFLHVPLHRYGLCPLVWENYRIFFIIYVSPEYLHVLTGFLEAESTTKQPWNYH